MSCVSLHVPDRRQAIRKPHRWSMAQAREVWVAVLMGMAR